ncbi:4387_t:CDS:2 [Ambispora gerdemannii]|uniref:4387_t:CDS:1 n=1 Tax=Ambispora gerdemannii TaxID=144530 RepID=A0A9N9E9K2_9GLOM|nr:4387_t:CDS:2 [Ambispora gerdemannii]
MPKQSATPSNNVYDTQNEKIELFFKSLKNKPIVEQKQKLGDRLFPKVKTADKNLRMKIQANKITIIFLEINDLHELAHSMNDPDIFKVKFEAAVTKITAAK